MGEQQQAEREEPASLSWLLPLRLLLLVHCRPNGLRDTSEAPTVRLQVFEIRPYSSYRNNYGKLFFHQLEVNSSIAFFWKMNKNSRHTNNFGK